MHYYQFNIADWTLHTAHLTLEEEAVYFRLLNHYYDTESPIPKETKPVIRRLRLGSDAEILGLILDEFFVEQDDGWHHKRCDEEIAAYHAKADKARANGRKGGRPKKGPEKTEPKPTTNPSGGGSDNSANPEETPLVILANPEETTSKANHKPLTNNHKPLTNLSDGASGEASNQVEVIPPEKPAKANRKTKLPADFLLTPERSDKAVNYWVAQQRFDLDPAVEFGKFQNYHRQHGKTMACWDSAWITWYNRAVPFNRPPLAAVKNLGTRERTLQEDLTDMNW